MGRTELARRLGGTLVIVATTTAATADAPFTEEAAARGIVYSTTMAGVAGQGTAFVDLDGDGDPDLIVLGAGNARPGTYENVGGTFIDRSATDGIDSVTKSSGVIAGDIDLDGDLDLYISRWGFANRLYRNDGGFHFTDITFAAGVGDTGDGAGCAWADYDLDGHLDLYVANMHGPNRLYRNLGGGVFTDVAPALGVDEPDDDTFQASFFDYDRDGDADLYCANAHGQYCDQLPFHNRLYENVGGTFVDVTEAAGVEACVDSMSIGIGDLDGNGWPDLYITNGPWGNALLLNQGDGTFTQSEVEAGVGSYVMGWGAVFFDADHDGHTDLYVCSGNAPNRLYRHDGAFPCTDVATDLGVDLGGFSYTVATADIDDDGDLDLLVQNADEPLRLFVNHADPARAWAKFDIVGEGAARHAIGAVIDVRCGDVHRVREVVAGCNFKNQNDLVQHVGLADAPVVDEITVVWPGGTTRTMTGHPVGRTWTVYPPDKLGDADGDGQRTLADFIHFIDCMTADGELLPGCEMMDDDGDADVDLDDLDALLERFDEPVADCNGNGIPDPVEIASGAAADDDGDGLIDDCDATPADLDGDGDVDAADLATLLAAWGTADANADLDGSGVVDAPDLAMLLANWT